MDPAVFWSGFGGAIVGAVIGGALTFAGGWLQTKKVLADQEQERLRQLYSQVLRVTDWSMGVGAALARELAPNDDELKLQGLPKSLRREGEELRKRLDAAEEASRWLSTAPDMRDVDIGGDYAMLAFEARDLAECLEYFDDAGVTWQDLLTLSRRVADKAEHLEDRIYHAFDAASAGSRVGRFIKGYVAFRRAAGLAAHPQVRDDRTHE